MDVTTLFVTVPNREIGLKIARALVEQRLVACANLTGEITSVYHWQGSVQTEPEMVLLLKTRSSLIDVATNQIKQIHPYECPCIVAWDSCGGNDAFSDWIRRETIDPPISC